MTRSGSGKNVLPLPVILRLLQGVQFPKKLGVCERLFGHSLSRHGIRWVRTAPGPVWKLDLDNPTHRWIVYGGYEGSGLWRWLGRQTRPFRTIVDSGANIGQTVLYFASLLPDARILAYEPGRAARQWLQEGIEANGFAQVSIEPAGLGASRRRAFLATVGSDDKHGSWNRIDASHGEPVEILTLDEELERHGISTLDFWKLDMEGYESEALAGAARSLAARRVRAVYIELGSSSDQSIRILRDHGYAPWLLSPSGRLAPLRSSGDWGNALFLAPKPPLAGSS